MTQPALFGTPAPSGSSVGATVVGFAVGDRFTFAGLPGQEPSAPRLPGSGSVGWLVEVLGLSPWGTLSVRCAPDAEALSDGQVVTVGLADAEALVRQGAWQPTQG